MGTIDVDSMTHWTVNTINDLRNDLRFEKVELSGKNIFDSILPGYRAERFDSESSYSNARIFLSSHGNETFPKGSHCYRLISQRNNQEFLSFNTDRPIDDKFDIKSEENINIVNNAREKFPDLDLADLKNRFQGIDWITVYSLVTGLEIPSLTKVQYNGQVFNATYNSTLEWKRDKQIQFSKSIIESEFFADNATELRKEKLNLARLENGCYMYNQTAINKLISLNFFRYN
ncbi:hypothetical protein [Acinetobacter stercoris]|uniref:Uncharacterized protein n=1 Tax=Acinetobacter stercoris TaxID=2126983 RepID=A0A2U3N4T3_9GAMM|nr:hypothetical protein [Acinetobacter stercoris]SPL72644.1 hypothetical protein KPC_3822 [Acinetobacter stercoris]